MLYFAAVTTLFMQETTRYYQQYLDFMDSGPSHEPHVTETEMFVSGYYYSDETKHT
jgi:hypothetical protein